MKPAQRDVRRSRLICLIDLFWTKYAHRILATVSTANKPLLLPHNNESLD